MWLAPRSTKGRGPFETEIQARFTPIRVLTQAVKTVAYLRVSRPLSRTFAASTPDNRRIAEKLVFHEINPSPHK